MKLHSLSNGCGEKRSIHHILLSTLGLLAVLLLAPGPFLGQANADPGVLIPENIKSEPDPAILSLDDMDTEVIVRDNFAMVRIRQVFRSHHSGELEGKYVFRIPPGALISAFAVWDGLVRIPGIIMEKARARRLYEEITARKIDPGILESSDEVQEPGYFSCRVFPIPPYGTKRLEISFNLLLPIDSGKVKFIIPFSPASFEPQKAANCSIKVSLGQGVPASSSSVSFAGVSKTLDKPAAFDLRNVAFETDLVIDYALETARNPVAVVTHPISGNQGYFMASALLGAPGAEPDTPKKGEVASTEGRRGIDLVIAVDTSFSVQWEKLEMTVDALSRILSFLEAGDRFDLVVFSDEPSPALGTLSPGNRDNTARAMAHFMSTPVGGGTDIAAAIAGSAGILESGRDDGRPGIILLIGDGSPTAPGPGPGRVVAAAEKALETRRGLRIFTLGLGDKVNTTLMGKIARSGMGHFEWCAGYDDVEYKAVSIASKLGVKPLGKPRFDWGLSSSEVYSRCGDNFGLNGTLPTVFPGQGIYFFGKYEGGDGTSAAWTLSADREGEPPLVLTGEASPGRGSADSSHVARLWARARVDFLVDKQRLEGENGDEIDEIIRLSREFSFVTPYTAFLAAPRALLRPRIIQPGDPVIRVRANPEIERIEAVFPFGVSKPMHPRGDDLWELRFLAPSWLSEGRHEVNLVLTDRHGRIYRETKWFVIDSSAPKLTVKPGQGPFVPGGRVPLKAHACRDTRRIRAWLPGLPPVDLRYSHESKASEGTLVLPVGIDPGRKEIRVVAEDFAKNITVTTVDIEISPAGGILR